MKTREEKVKQLMKTEQNRKPIALLPQKTVVVALHLTTDGVAIPQEELNEWGYPTGAYTFKGCTTERTVMTPKEEDAEPYTHVEHTNIYSKSNNPTQDRRTKNDLKEECRVLGLKIGGNKADLIARLDAFYEASDADDLHINDEGELINPAKEGEEE